MNHKLMVPLLVCILSLCALGLTGGCGNKNDGYPEGEPECRSHKCSCLDNIPHSYSVSIYFEECLAYKVPYTVKWKATHYGGGRYATVPTTVHKITAGTKIGGIFYSFEEPAVSDSGMMRFRNALTGQQEAIHFVGVHWVVQEVFKMGNQEGRASQAYARKYIRAYKRCEACNGSHKHTWEDYRDQ